MTNRELIDLLSEFDPEMPVAIASDQEWNDVRTVVGADQEKFEKHGHLLEPVDPEDGEAWADATEHLVIW